MTRHRREQHWAVTVTIGGDQVVTIESNCLSGRDISDDDARVIRMAAAHLLSFVGPERQQAEVV